MAFSTIEVVPTLDTSAYADNDVLFTSAAVKLPHRHCKVLSVSAIWNDAQAVGEDIIVMFFKENTNALGTINDAASISGANLKANVFLGASRLSNNGETSLGVPTLLVSQHMNDDSAVISGHNSFVLTEGSTKNTCYVQGLLEAGSGTFDADSLVLSISVEY
jgi:hypothetical protein